MDGMVFMNVTIILLRSGSECDALLLSYGKKYEKFSIRRNISNLVALEDDMANHPNLQIQTTSPNRSSFNNITNKSFMKPL